jgi:hypothetical protein
LKESLYRGFSVCENSKYEDTFEIMSDSSRMAFRRPKMLSRYDIFVYVMMKLSTLKSRFNESEGTKDFVLYSKSFVIAGALYYRIYYRGTQN